MIPKTIHYCWFGGNPLPKLAQKCIKSWEKYCSDYEIVRWDESNFDVSSAPLYVRQAYEAKKWAFVTDYVRLWAITKYGGIYMDTDVEVVKPIDDLLTLNAFCGFANSTMLSTAIMACQAKFPLFTKCKKHYDKLLFEDSKNSRQLISNVVIITNIFVEEGLKQNCKFQLVHDCTILPVDYFSPKDDISGLVHRTKNTYTIHHYDGSWLDEQTIKIRNKRYFMNSIDYFLHTPNRIIMNCLGQEKYEVVKMFIKGK